MKFGYYGWRNNQENLKADIISEADYANRKYQLFLSLTLFILR
jgi:hypothetical protein